MTTLVHLPHRADLSRDTLSRYSNVADARRPVRPPARRSTSDAGTLTLAIAIGSSLLAALGAIVLLAVALQMLRASVAGIDGQLESWQLQQTASERAMVLHAAALRSAYD